MRQVQGLPSHSPSPMVWGELGIMPLRHRWYKHTLRFWDRLGCAETSGLLWFPFYEGSRIAREVVGSRSTHHDIWSCRVKKNYHKQCLVRSLSVYQELNFHCMQHRILGSFRDKAMCDTSTAGFSYRTIKHEHALWPYLTMVKKDSNILTRFGCGSHWLDMSQGRYLKLASWHARSFTLHKSCWS